MIDFSYCVRCDDAYADMDGLCGLCRDEIREEKECIEGDDDAKEAE